MLLEDYESRNTRLQEAMVLIEELVKGILMAEKLLEIKGVGIRTVSGFLAEAGDISRFNNPKELQKLAGLALVENSSGKHKGETTISRRGRKRLRYLLFEGAMSHVAKNPEFRELHNYYTTRRLNPLKKMQSLMAIAAKLISMFYYRSRNNKEVDFVLRKGTKIERLVLVCYDMSNPKTEKREVDSIVECAGELKCDNLVIVTNNDKRTIEKDGYKIDVVPIPEF